MEMLITPLEVIDLVHESVKKKPPQLVDLTKFEQEVIDLDETLSQLNNSICELEVINNDVENVSMKLCRSFGNKLRNYDYIKHNDSDIQIVSLQNNDRNILINKGSSSSRKSKNNLNPNKIVPVRNRKQFSWTCSASNNELKILRNATRQKKSTLCKSGSGDISVIYQSNGINNRSANKSKSLNNQSPKKSHRRNSVQIGRKYQNHLDNTFKELSGDVIKYYNNLDIIINNNKKHMKKVTPKRKSNKLRRGICRSPSKSEKKEKIKQKKEKKEFALQQILGNISYKKKVKTEKEGHRKRVPSKTNIFNPNPYDVDQQGLRPVVLDGSNIAIGHGKGTFSVKGLKICVDYFAKRGHQIVKLFLPEFRKDYFSDELMVDLKTKCDIIFTPSRLINGKWATPYDDRYIVQYAVEFEGVIVSKDNFRDLLRENPLWRHTIQDRLLMFTWVDDLLMFPIDPLGSKGPTLDEFLRF